MEQTTIDKTFEYVSKAADIITIVGLIWASFWSFYKRKRTLLGFNVNLFLVNLLRLILIVISGSIFIYVWSQLIFPFTSILFGLSFSADNYYWDNGEHFIQYILSYLTSISLVLIVYWLLISIIWYSNFERVIDFFNIWIPPKVRIKKRDRNKLEIISAKYGTDNISVDVTDKLKQMVDNNSLSVIASNDLAGDPIIGTPKMLFIAYKTNNYETKSMEIAEGELLNLDVRK